MDESAAPVKRPRFPWPFALLCAASLAAAAWTWMRYSYAWEVTAEAVHRDFMAFVEAEKLDFPDNVGREARARHFAMIWQPYLRVRGIAVVGEEYRVVALLGPEDHSGYVNVILANDEALPPPDVDCVYVGRRCFSPGSHDVTLYLDTTASRFTWQSITGLAVGAMGVFVFAVYLWRWVKEQRASRDTAG